METTIIAVSTIVIGVVLLFLFSQSFVTIETGEGCIVENLAGQPVNIFLSQVDCRRYHVNRPDTDYHDSHFDDYVILPNAWGKPKDRDPNTLLWKPEDQQATKKVTFAESANSTMFGYVFIGLWPFRKRHSYIISYTKVRDKSYELKKGEKVSYEGKSRKIITVDDSPTNHFRIFSEIGIVILDKETGGSPDDTYKGIQNIKVNGTYGAGVHVIDVFKFLSTTQNGFYRILSQKIEGIVKEVFGANSYTGLIRSKDETGQTGTVNATIHTINLDRTAENGTQSFIGMYGGGVYDITNLDLDASAESKKLIDAVDREFIASQDAKVAKLRGQGKGWEYAGYVSEKTKVDKTYLTEVVGEQNRLIKDLGVNPNLEAVTNAITLAGCDANVYAPGGDSILKTLPILDENYGKLPDFEKYVFPETIEVIKEVIVEKSADEENNSENNSDENSNSTDNSNNNSNQNNNNQNNNSGNSSKNKNRNNNRNNNRNRNGKGGGKGGNNGQNKGNNNNKPK
jgi:hypothetical protein